MIGRYFNLISGMLGRLARLPRWFLAASSARCVAGPLGSPRTGVSSRGLACHPTTASKPPTFRASCTARARRGCRDSVKGVGQKHMVHGLADQPCNITGIRLTKREVRGTTTLCSPHLCGCDQRAVYVDCDDVSGDFRDGQREPAIARTKVHNRHVGFNANIETTLAGSGHKPPTSRGWAFLYPRRNQKWSAASLCSAIAMGHHSAVEVTQEKSMSVHSPDSLAVDIDELRKEVQNKYREVALDPHGAHHFHTGRYLAKHLGYDATFVASLPDAAVESFAGVANPFSLSPRRRRALST